MKKITKETTLSEVLKISGSEEVLSKHRVPCLGCAFAEFEMDKLKIGDVCKIYQISLENLLKDLNELSKKK